MDPFESEDVKIGGWETRLPSDICTNRSIFDTIFSLDTWNNVLSAEQRARLTQMLPKEVVSSPDLTKQTIEDLFSGELTTFSTPPPLDDFFDKLDTGQFDPVVTQMKLNIKRTLRRESLRQMQNYHTKLLEHIVVSRQRYLNRLKARVTPLTNKSRSRPSRSKAAKEANAKKQPGVGVLQNASSELNTKLSSIANTGVGSTTITTTSGGKGKSQKPVIKVEDMNKSSITSSHSSNSRKRRGKEDPSLDDLGGGKPPASKKPTKSKPTSTGGKPSKPIAKKSGKGQGKTELNQTSASDKKTVSQKHASEHNVKLERICPSSIRKQDQLGIIVSASQQSSFVTHSDSILNAALTSDKLLKPSTLTSSSISSIYTSPTKSSPILASQLQASPQISVKMEDSLNFFSSHGSEPDSGCITLNYQKLEEKSSGEDDLESSSDEFEAIQPTIGFGTSLLPHSSVASTMSCSPGMLSPNSTFTKVMLSSGSILQTMSSTSSSPTSATTTLATNRIIQVQSQDAGFATVTSASSSQPNPVYILSTSKTVPSEVSAQPQGRIIQIQKDVMKSHLPISSQQLALMNSTSPKIIVKGTSMDHQHQFLHKSMVTTTTTTGQDQEIIRISNADLLTAKSTGSGVHYVTNSGRNIILHPMTSSSTLNQSFPSTSVCKLIPSSSSGSHIISSNTSFANLNQPTPGSEIGGGVQFATNSNQLKSLNDSSLSLNSSSLLENDELNLSLSSLGSLGLGMGMNTSNLSNISAGSLDGIMDSENMKLEMDVIDKIDDLSVLDGNPFDSIPNLSDELDGLDLDLVDGLCDFEGLLSDEKKYPSFFSLIREVLCSTRDHRMTLVCLEKTIRKWAASPGAALNSWFLNIADWNKGLVTALNFLAGTYQDVHPEDFVPYIHAIMQGPSSRSLMHQQLPQPPYIEYKYKTKYYQWIGAGRDGDNNLTPLCSMWMENLERLPSIKKIDGETEDQEEEDEENEDSELTEDAKKKNKRPLTPPPPRCVTDWTVRPSSEDEKNLFRVQERSRFDNPHKAFTYNMHLYESVVGPVKGVYSSQVGMTNKARGHSLLVDDRPPYVTILALVRDAVARLPNGEGTRSEICEMLRDSAFLAPDASSVTLNSVVSGALDRLHYERDPCVRYDSHKKSWIYLHRDRTQEQFERLHHNRSYTKSTKSRNTTTRKSRRSTAKASTPTSGTTPLSTTNTSLVGSGSSTPITSTSPVSSATVDNSTTAPDDHILLPTANEPNKQITSKPGPLVSKILQVNPGQSSASGNTDPQPENQIKSESTSYPAADSGMALQTIKLTPLSLQQPEGTVLKVTGAPSLEASGIPPQTMQYIVQTSSAPSTMTSGSQQSTIQLHSSGRTVQIQGFPANLSASSSGGETIIVSGQQTGTTSAPTSQGQMVFGPQTVLRIANALRLSQLRLPGNTIPGNVRAPTQHRILLTRGAVPGQPGILLGHTSTGQTVILSTTGGHSFPTLSTPTQAQVHSLAQLQHQQTENIVSSGNSGDSTSPTVTTYSLRPMLGKQAGAPLQQGVPLLSTTRPMMTPTIQTINSNSGQMFDLNSSSSSPKMIQLNIATGGSASALMKSGIATSTTSTQALPSGVNITSQPSDYVITSSSGPTTIGGGIQTQRHPVGYTIATVRGNSMALQQGQSHPSTISRTIGGQTIQLQALAGQNQLLQSSTAAHYGQNQMGAITISGSSARDSSDSSGMMLTPNTTPIIIRSMAGDLMLPGHIALGKGGIKLFPFPVGNNKTMLAKIIPPNSSTTPTPTTPNTAPRLVNVSVGPPTGTTTTDIPMTSPSPSFNLVSTSTTTKSTSSPPQTQTQ